MFHQPCNRWIKITIKLLTYLLTYWSVCSSQSTITPCIHRVNVSMQLPPEFVSSSSMLYVHFKTDDTIFGKGFAAVYMQVDSAALAPTGAQLPPAAAETNGAGPHVDARTARRGKPPSTTTKKFPYHHRHHQYQRHRQQHLRAKTSRFVTWLSISDQNLATSQQCWLQQQRWWVTHAWNHSGRPLHTSPKL